MWMVSNLWNKYHQTNEDKETYHVPTGYLLREDSPRTETPNECPVPLWPHQQAMLYRIKDIEQKRICCETDHTDAVKTRYMDKSIIDHPPEVCLGIMNDPPGSGKTYAILTAILTDSIGPSIIIVPQNIYGQWRSSIECIFQNQLEKCLFSSSYMDIMNIYGNPKKVKEYHIILLQDSFAEAFLKVLNDKEISVRRIVIDEIDIMDKFICSSVHTDYVWLMSASYKDQPRLGPYFIRNIEDVICKCDLDFVQESLQLPEPVLVHMNCDDDHVQLFDGILDAKQMKALHAGDFKLLNRTMNVTGTSVTPLNMKEMTQKYAEYLLKKTDELEDLRKTYQECNALDERTEKEQNILRDKISLLEMYHNHALLLQRRLELLPNIEGQQFKEKYLEDDFVKEMLEKKESKWLVFNDNGNTLINYQNILNSKEIKTTMLDGGNQKRIEKALEDYKKGDTQVLLLNSMIEGAGMNLENTTHLLFMHKTEDKFINQVVGRAQRFGRTCPLRIIMLFNKHE